jgi:hypothetical protein
MEQRRVDWWAENLELKTEGKMVDLLVGKWEGRKEQMMVD